MTAPQTISTGDPKALSPLTISSVEFEQLRSLIREWSGISLADSKRELLCNRLSPRLRALGLTSFGKYHRPLLSDSSQSELTHCLDAISTNKTEFFRGADHFAHLENEVLPDLIARRTQEGHHRLRIWSAGCSTGEESQTAPGELGREEGIENLTKHLLAHPTAIVGHLQSEHRAQ